MNNSQGHRRSIAFISGDIKYVQIVHKGQYKVHKQTRLCNKYVFTNDIINVVLQDRVEVEVQHNCFKVFDLTRILLIRTLAPSNIETHSNTKLIHLLIDKTMAVYLLKTNNCLAVVDSSFFLEHLEYILAYQKFIYNKKVFVSEDFIATVSMHLQSACVAEVYRGLSILMSVKLTLDNEYRRKKSTLLLGLIIRVQFIGSFRN